MCSRIAAELPNCGARSDPYRSQSYLIGVRPTTPIDLNPIPEPDPKPGPGPNRALSSALLATRMLNGWGELDLYWSLAAPTLTLILTLTLPLIPTLTVILTLTPTQS